VAALGGRIALLGVERIVVKRLGAGSNGVAPAFLFFLIATLLLAPLLAFAEMPDQWGWLLLVAANGLVYAAAFVLYVAALAAGEASFVSPFYNFNVLFLLLLAALFLAEAFTAAKLAGLALLVAGSWLLARPARAAAADGAGGSGGRESNRRAALLMIGCSLLMAVGRTVDAFQVRSVGSIVYSFAIYSANTVWLGCFVLAAGRGGEALRLLRTAPWTALASGAVNAFSYLLLLVALGSMEVSVAEPASMLSLLVTLGLAGIVLREPVAGRVLPTLLMIAGAWILLAR
jgi:transporter family protein